MLTFEAIEQAQRRMGNEIRVTPCAPSEGISEQIGARLFLKLENLQRTGSFKERGALNTMLSLPPEERARGVIAASAGNHAQGVALSAHKLGIQATICMPRGTPLIKVQRTRSFGAEVILYGESYDEAAAHATALASDQDRTLIHPFDDPRVIAGQGTVALELLQQNPFIDLVVVPIGGGGLISGMALALKETNPRVKVIGVEADAIPAARESLRAGERVTLTPVRTIADGIAVSRIGEHTFPLIQRYVDDVVTVTDEEIASAILLLLEDEKTVAEAAAATTIAALMAGRVDVAGKRVCALISGGNIDVNVISRIIERGLVQDGRRMRARVNIPDIPGQLARLTTLIADMRANVIAANHTRTFDAPFGKATIELTLDTRGVDHIEEIRAALVQAGYEVIELHQP